MLDASEHAAPVLNDNGGVLPVHSEMVSDQLFEIMDSEALPDSTALVQEDEVLEKYSEQLKAQAVSELMHE